MRGGAAPRRSPSLELSASPRTHTTSPHPRTGCGPDQAWTGSRPLQAHHITAPPDDGDGARRAMEAALRLGNVAPAELGYINAHATSTPTGDAAEAIAIAAIAAQRGGPGCGPLLVSSTKGATGHLLGAAGAAEAAFTVLALSAGRVPPTANLADPEPASAAFEHVLPRETGPAGRAPLPELRAALCNSFGFGGMNASVLFTRPGLEWAMPKRGHLGG